MWFKWLSLSELRRLSINFVSLRPGIWSDAGCNSLGMDVPVKLAMGIT